MNKGNKYLAPVIGVVIAVTLLVAQGSGYLSQKLILKVLEKSSILSDSISAFSPSEI